MYGSSFCIRTRRPRCSSSMPIEALVSPLPSELTTPPVTKMCLVMRARLGWGVYPPRKRRAVGLDNVYGAVGWTQNARWRGQGELIPGPSSYRESERLTNAR